MAESEKAIASVLRAEGVYDNDPKDPGGETVFGINKRDHPEWPGWARVETLRSSPSFPVILAKDAEIQAQVTWYYRGLWASMDLDCVGDQALAESIYHAVINQGQQTAIKGLQRILNALSVDDIPEDGDLGPRSHDRLSGLLSVGRGPVILDAFEAWRKMRYIEITYKNRSLQRYIAGWFNRVNRGQ